LGIGPEILFPCISQSRTGKNREKPEKTGNNRKKPENLKNRKHREKPENQEEPE
jgi:hypothetical protein